MNKIDKIYEKNFVEIKGTVSKEAVYSHETYGEKFYTVHIKSERISGTEDEIPVLISERMCNVKELCLGQSIGVVGQFRTFNEHSGNKHRLVISVFARELYVLDDEDAEIESNYIQLDGYLCKEPTYRKTPLGREISDFLLAVNRSYGKSDYAPCIAWGRNARFTSCFEVGSHVKICGRIQSREYQKRLEDGDIETRTTYEVSVSKVELVAEEEEKN